MIDLEYLHHVSDRNQDFINQMILGFLEGTPSLIKEMYRSFKSRNWNELAITAHKLKPSANYMGISGLYHIIEKLEEEAKSDQPDKQIISSYLNSIRTTCKQAYPLLRREIR